MALKKKTKAKAAKPMAKSLYKKGGPVSVKGVATKGLTKKPLHLKNILYIILRNILR